MLCNHMPSSIYILMTRRNCNRTISLHPACSCIPPPKFENDTSLFTTTHSIDVTVGYVKIDGADQTTFPQSQTLPKEQGPCLGCVAANLLTGSHVEPRAHYMP